MPKLSNKIKIILVFDLIVLVICLFGIFQTFEKAGLEPNTHVSFDVSDGNIFINKITNPEFHAVLSKGDRLVSIEGHPVSSKEDIEFIFDSFNVGQKASLLLNRNGIELHEVITLPRYYSLLYLIVQIIVGCVFFLNGVFVIYKRPTDLAARIWHWASICIAIIIMCTWGRFSISPTGSGHLIRNIFSVAYAFVPTLYLHLTYVFPRIKLGRPNILFNPLYAFSLLLALWMIVTFELAARQFSMDWFHNYLIAFDINRIYFAIVILFGMGNLIHSYIKAREQSEKRKIRWVLSGLAIGPPAFVIFWQIPQLLSIDSIIPEEIIVLFMIIVPITFTISIVKYHIFNIDLILQRSTVYIIVLSILILIYSGIVAITAIIVGTFTLETSLTISVIAAVIIALLFEPARKKVQNFVDKKFFRIRYNYRLVQRNMTDRLNNIYNIKELAELVNNELNSLLQPELIGFFMRKEKGRKWFRIADKNCNEIPVNQIREIYTNYKTSKHIILAFKDYVETGALFEEVNKPEIFPLNTVLSILIKDQNKQVIGMLILGKKIRSTV